MGTVLEFYCGIGGLRFAYEMALDALPPTHPLKSATHIVSFDISEFLLFCHNNTNYTHHALEPPQTDTTTSQIYEATFHESVQRVCALSISSPTHNTLPFTL